MEPAPYAAEGRAQLSDIVMDVHEHSSAVGETAIFLQRLKRISIDLASIDFGPLQPGFLIEDDASQAGIHQISLGEVGPGKVGMGKVCTHELGFAEISMNEGRRGDFRSLEIGAAEVSSCQVGIMKICTVKISAAEVAASKVGAPDDDIEIELIDGKGYQLGRTIQDSAEVGAAEVRHDIRVVFPPSVPCIDTGFDDGQVLFARQRFLPSLEDRQQTSRDPFCQTHERPARFLTLSREPRGAEVKLPFEGVARALSVGLS